MQKAQNCDTENYKKKYVGVEDKNIIPIRHSRSLPGFISFFRDLSQTFTFAK